MLDNDIFKRYVLLLIKTTPIANVRGASCRDSRSSKSGSNNAIESTKQTTRHFVNNTFSILNRRFAPRSLLPHSPLKKLPHLLLRPPPHPPRLLLLAPHLEILLLHKIPHPRRRQVQLQQDDQEGERGKLVFVAGGVWWGEGEVEGKFFWGDFIEKRAR